MTIDHPGTPTPAPTPTASPVAHLSSAAAPERRIGVTGIVFFVVAASAPLTVAAGGIPQSLGVTGILGIPLLYLLVGVVLALFSAGYAAMSRHITGAGAFYAYTAQGLGRTAGVGAAFVALLAYNAMQIGIAGLFGATTAQFIESKTGADIPWWALVFACTAVVGVLGHLRVDLGVKVLAVLLVLEFGTVFVFDIGQFADAPQGISTTPLTWGAATDGSLGVALCCVFAAYMGFESAALYSEECRDPRRTVARATYIAVGLIGVFYAVTAWAMISGAGTGRATRVAAEQGPEMLFFLSDRSSGLGTAFSDFAQLFLITSLLAALLSFHNAVARYVRSLGREGVLPRGLGALHPRYGSPYRGSLLQTVVSVVVIGVFALAGRDPVMDVFTWLTNLGALGVILLLLATSASVIAYFARRGEMDEEAVESVWHRLIAPLLSGVALAVFFWLALTNFSVQLGVSEGNPLRWALPCLILIAAAAGVVWGLWLRRARPEVHAGIGSAAGS
ncbi:APC family permease [Streptomyces durmitorensis]|uniref:APC family permease n=1 Tax=Streptomyces durmitorensis TaxID=319947 RepID=A0ABY4PXU3_9ACTN|nr:APC family permease [Streptomyces durmitorensis]UQT58665.1 APC family permease [Streptomyces durmitorensis]